MKKITLLNIMIPFILFCIFMSCSKSNSSSNNSSGPATFTFKAGDSTFTMNGDLTQPFSSQSGSRVTWDTSSGGVLNFYVEAEDGKGNEFMAFTTGVQFSQTTYQTPPASPIYLTFSTFLSPFSPANLYTDPATDRAVLVVTSIHDNLADGIFNGTISNHTDTAHVIVVTVTNGEFHNLKIYPYTHW